MSLIKHVSMTIDGGKKSMELSDARTIIVRGRMKEHFLYVVESLLAMDTSGYYGEIDKQAGANYKDIEDEAFVLFQDGGIRSVDKVVQTSGVVPSTHVIRYTGADEKFRSFYMEQGLSTYSTVYTDMRKYSHVISDAKWFRLLAMVNDLLGFEFVTADDGELAFHPMNGFPVSPDGQKFIYLLMAECYLTPEKYRRVLLLSDIPYLTTELQIKFLKRLGDIPGHGVTFSTSKVEFTDIQERDSISFLSV